MRLDLAPIVCEGRLRDNSASSTRFSRFRRQCRNRSAPSGGNAQRTFPAWSDHALLNCQLRRMLAAPHEYTARLMRRPRLPNKLTASRSASLMHACVAQIVQDRATLPCVAALTLLELPHAYLAARAALVACHNPFCLSQARFRPWRDHPESTAEAERL